MATEQKYWSALARLKAYTGYYWDDERLLLDAVEDATKSGDKATEAAAVEQCAAYFGKHGLFGCALWYILPDRVQARTKTPYLVKIMTPASPGNWGGYGGNRELGPFLRPQGTSVWDQTDVRRKS